MKKMIVIIGILLLCAGAAFAQGQPSAKFAATWNTDMGLSSVAEIKDATEDQVLLDSDTGFTLATVKIPQDKELLIGISAEIGLITDTSVKGKNGGSATSLANAEAYVTVFAVPKDGGNSVEAAPGTIILSKRIQALTATLGGVIQSCRDGSDGSTPDGTINVPTECDVTDEEIGLLQDTTAAHHFNFVLPNMNQGVYDIKAFFTTGAQVEVDICDAGETCSYDPDGTVSASAYAKAVVNKTMLTVQQVRAAKGGVIDATILD